MPSEYIWTIAAARGIGAKKAKNLWEHAKDIASKSNYSGNITYQTGVFKEMLGEKLTLRELTLLREYAWETSVMVPSSLAKLLNKLLKNKNLKAAVDQYVEFSKKGMNRGTAIHKAASIYGFSNEKMFSDLVAKLEKNGLLEDTNLGISFSRFMGGEVSTEHVVSEFFSEEGEPTNTSGEVAPDRDHVSNKKEIAKRKKVKKNVDIDSEISPAEKDKEKSKMEANNRTFKSLSNYINEGKKRKPRLPVSVKNKIKKLISKFPPYVSSIIDPINDVDDALNKSGYMLANEDGTPFGAIFTGASGRTTIEISTQDGEFVDNYLHVQWHKMRSGRQYEVNMYMTP